MRKRWKFAECDKEIAKMLAEECDTDPFVALLCASRGHDTPEDLEEFISLEPMFADVFTLPDMEAAVDTILAAIDDKLKIAVFGDYDCDGVTATALLVRCLRSMGANVCYKIPDRLTEGYGMTSAAVEELAAQGVELIITVDNGITAFAAADRAAQLGIGLVITDHHLPIGELPEADAIIDPHREDSAFGFRDIAGVGVAFRLACALQGACAEELLYEYADLLAIGTVADVMPLVHENRVSVAEGIRAIDEGANPGVTALLKEAGFEGKELNASAIAFVVAPRLNAAGRLGSADRAVELLLAETVDDALPLAAVINRENSRRQHIEQEIYERAVRVAEQDGYVNDRVIVVCGENWHKGIVGISAAKMCEKYSKPVILLSSDGDTAVGSGRSIKGFSLFDAINECADLTDRFGGHELAAGLTLPTALVDAFRRRINEYAAEQEMPIPELSIDCKLKPSALNFDLADAVGLLEPFGSGNPVPVFAVCGVRIEKIIPLSQGKHIKIHFSKEYSAFVGLLFGTSPETFGYSVGDVVDVALTVSTGTYNGDRQLNLQIKDLRMNGTDDELQFNTLRAYNNFTQANDSDTTSLFMCREYVGMVYRAVGTVFAPVDRIVHKLESNGGCGKVMAALDVLNELGLISYQNVMNTKCCKKNFVNQKNDLMNSEIYRALSREY